MAQPLWVRILDVDRNLADALGASSGLLVRRPNAPVTASVWPSPTTMPSKPLGAASTRPTRSFSRGTSRSLPSRPCPNARSRARLAYPDPKPDLFVADRHRGTGPCDVRPSVLKPGQSHAPCVRLAHPSSTRARGRPHA